MIENLNFLKENKATNNTGKIRACIGTFADFIDSVVVDRQNLKKLREKFPNLKEEFDASNSSRPEYINILTGFGLENIENVDWFANGKNLENFLNDGPESYVISALSEKNKRTDGVNGCTVLIVAGVDKKTGKNISFLSHQWPKKILEERTTRWSLKEKKVIALTEKFKKDLSLRLEEIKDSCILDDTLDSVIMGGAYLDDKSKARYDKMIQLISNEVKNILGKKPEEINGPKNSINFSKNENQTTVDEVWYSNNDRRVFFVRPEVNQVNTEKTAAMP